MTDTIDKPPEGYEYTPRQVVTMSEDRPARMLARLAAAVAVVDQALKEEREENEADLRRLQKAVHDLAKANKDLTAAQHSRDLHNKVLAFVEKVAGRVPNGAPDFDVVFRAGDVDDLREAVGLPRAYTPTVK